MMGPQSDITANLKGRSVFYINDEYCWHLDLKSIWRHSVATIDIFGSEQLIAKGPNFMVFSDQGWTFLDVVLKLYAFVVVQGLDSCLFASEFEGLALGANLDETVGAGGVGIPHEDVVDLGWNYLYWGGVPEKTGVVRLALRVCTRSNRNEQQQREKGEIWTLHHLEGLNYKYACI